MMKVINLISTPRNISTALMYSFSNRPDTGVIDEPFYGYYLTETGKTHPGREEILKTQPGAYPDVYKQIFAYDKRPVFFVKNMSKHLRTTDWSKMQDMQNIILIRNPKRLISSFAKVIDTPSMEDIGLKTQYEMYQFLEELGQPPIVLDSGQLLIDPENVLRQLCSRLGIYFSEKMLSWSAGPIPEDGVWAPYWYKNVHKSTGFQMQSTEKRVLPESLEGLYETCLPYYDKLFALSIQADGNQ